MGKVYLSQFNFKNYMGADSINVQNNYQTPAYLEELSLDNSNNIYLSKKTGLRYDYLVTTEGEDQVYVNSNLVGFCRDLTELKETDFLNKDIVNYRLAYNMHTAFSNCYQLGGTPVSARNVRSMYGTYYNCQALTGRAAVNANVNNLIGTYYNCNSITTVPHTTENARMMIDTFYNCTNLEGSPTDADLAVSMQNAYYNCYLLEGAPANCNSAIITVNAYYNCPNMYGNFYWCNRDFDQAEKIRAVNMFYNRDTSKRLNIYIRRDSAVENALLNYSDTFGDIYGTGSIAWTPYPVAAEYPNYYYNTAYNTNVIYLENIVNIYFNLAKYSGIGYNFVKNDDRYVNNSQNRYNNAHVTIEKRFLTNVVQNIQDVPQGYVYDSSINQTGGHYVNVYKKVVNETTLFKPTYGNKYYESANKNAYIYLNKVTSYFIICTEGYEFAECYLLNNYLIDEQIRLVNKPYLDINNIFNTDRVGYMNWTYVAQFKNNFYGDDTVKAICPKKVTDMNYVYTSTQGKVYSYFNGTLYYTNIISRFYNFNAISNTYELRDNRLYQGNSWLLLIDELFNDSNIKYTVDGFTEYIDTTGNWNYIMPLKKIIPVSGNSVINMNYTYWNTNIMNYRPACGPNVINMHGTYFNCEGVNVKPYFGSNVLNARNAYANSNNFIAENRYYISPKMKDASGLYAGSSDNLWYNLNNIILSNNLNNIAGCFAAFWPPVAAMDRNIIHDYYNRSYGINFNITINSDLNNYMLIFPREDKKVYISHPNYPDYNVNIEELKIQTLAYINTKNYNIDHLVNVSGSFLPNSGNLKNAGGLFIGQENLISPISFNGIYNTQLYEMYFLCRNLVAFNGPYSNYNDLRAMGFTCYGDTNLRFVDNTPSNFSVPYLGTFGYCPNLTNIIINNTNYLKGTFVHCNNLTNIVINDLMKTQNNICYLEEIIYNCPSLYTFTINNIPTNAVLSFRENTNYLGSPISVFSGYEYNRETMPGIDYMPSTFDQNTIMNDSNLIYFRMGNRTKIDDNIFISMNFQPIDSQSSFNNKYFNNCSNLFEIAPRHSGLLPFITSAVVGLHNMTSLSIGLHHTSPVDIYDFGIAFRGTLIENCSNLKYIYTTLNFNFQYNFSNNGREQFYIEDRVNGIVLKDLPNLTNIKYVGHSNQTFTAGSFINRYINCPNLRYLLEFETNQQRDYAIDFNHFEITPCKNFYYPNDEHFIYNNNINTFNYCEGCPNLIDIVDIPYTLSSLITFNTGVDTYYRNRQLAQYYTFFNNLPNFTAQNLQGLYISWDDVTDSYSRNNYHNSHLTVFDSIPNLNLYNLNKIIISHFGNYDYNDDITPYYMNEGFKFTNNCNIVNIKSSLNEFMWIQNAWHLGCNCSNNNIVLEGAYPDIITLFPYNSFNHYLYGRDPENRQVSRTDVTPGILTLENGMNGEYFTNSVGALRFNSLEISLNNINYINYCYITNIYDCPERVFAQLECVNHEVLSTFMGDQRNNDGYWNWTQYITTRQHMNNFIVNKNNIYKNYYSNFMQKIKKAAIIPLYGSTFSSDFKYANFRGMKESYYGDVGLGGTDPIFTLHTPAGTSNMFLNHSSSSDYNYVNQAFYYNYLFNYENYYGYNINNIDIYFIAYNGDIIEYNIRSELRGQITFANLRDMLNKDVVRHTYLKGNKCLANNLVTNLNMSNISLWNLYEIDTQPELGFIQSFYDSGINKQRTAIFGSQTFFNLEVTDIDYYYSTLNIFNLNDSNAYNRDRYNVLINEFPSGYCGVGYGNRIARAYNTERNINIYWTEKITIYDNLA